MFQRSERRRRGIERYKEFPPGWGQLRVPTSSRSAALAGLAMYAACRPRGVWALRAVRMAVWALGPKALPGRARPWRPPLEDELWSALLTRWREDLGQFDEMAVYERTQPHRPGFALLLMQSGRPIAFLRLRKGGAS